MNLRKLLNWRSLLIYSHRWLGIALGIMFVVWCISGIILMYVSLPRLTAAERLMKMQALDLSTLQVAPAQAAAKAGLTGKKAPTRVRVAMLDGRPVYRIASGNSWTAVYADTGEPIKSVDAEQARRVLAAFIPESASKIRYEAYLNAPDLFTVDSPFRQVAPLHRFAVDDGAGTKYYVSERTGEVALRTDRMSRFWGFSGYIMHRLTFMKTFSWWSPFWVSFLWFGLIMCLSGIVLGIWRFSPSARFRQKRVATHTPYAGWMMWHHYAGLIFGLFIFTWTISGSMMGTAIPGIAAPFFGGGRLTKAQQDAVTGGSFNLKGLTAEAVRASAGTINASFAPKEMELQQFEGKAYFVAYKPPTPEEAEQWISTSIGDFLAPGLDQDHVFVAALHPEQGVFQRFDDSLMLETARKAMPGVRMIGSEWMSDYDDYYYKTVPTFNSAALKAVRPLPVLRIRFDDAEKTIMYLSPTHGQVAKYAADDRFKRWGYFGQHALDFRFMLNHRPVWDIVTALLLIGSTVLSATTLVPMWRRLVRHGRRMWSKVLGRPKAKPVLTPQVARGALNERPGFGD